jgi:hypothetical protein
MKQTTRFLLHTAVFSVAFLALSGGAWAQISATVWSITGNDESLTPVSSGLNTSAGGGIAGTLTLEGVATYASLGLGAINFNATGSQFETGTLTAAQELTGFLGSTTTDTIGATALASIMSGGVGTISGSTSTGSPFNQLGTSTTKGCYNNSGGAESTGTDPSGATGCYSTVIEITGTANFFAGEKININSDDGVEFYIGTTNVINNGAPTAASGASGTVTSAEAGTGVAFTIWYEGTNGNPEQLTVTTSSTPEPGSVSMLLTMLGGIAGFAFVLKKKLA